MNQPVGNLPPHFDEFYVGKCIDYEGVVDNRLRHEGPLRGMKYNYKIIRMEQIDNHKWYRVKSNAGNGDDEEDIWDAEDIKRIFDCPVNPMNVNEGNMVQLNVGDMGENHNENMNGGRKQKKRRSTKKLRRKQRKSRKQGSK